MKRLLLIGLLNTLLPLYGIDLPKRHNDLPDSNTLIEEIDKSLIDSPDFLNSFSWINTCNLNKSTTGWTPLSKAIAKGLWLTTEKLMQRGASLEEAIKRAIEHDSTDALIHLLHFVQVHHTDIQSINISFFQLDYNGITPLGYAIQKSSQRCIALLQQEPFNATTFDTLRIALMHTNQEIIKALFNRNYEATVQEIAGQLYYTLTNNDTELLRKIYQTINSLLLNEITKQLKKLYPNLFNEGLPKSFAQTVALSAALSRDDARALSAIFAEEEPSQEVIENTFKSALARNSFRCVEYLLQDINVVPSISTITPFMYTYNQDVINLYLHEYCSQRVPDKKLFDELISLADLATSKRLTIIKTTCYQLLSAYFIYPFIEADDLSSLQKQVAEFIGKQLPINFIDLYEQALVCNASASAQWLLPQIKGTLSLISFTEVLEDNNTALVQEHLRTFLEPLAFTALTEQDFQQLIFDLEYALPDAIKMLSTDAAKKSWKSFYAQTIQPLLDQFVVKD